MPNHPDSDRYFFYNESLLGLSTKMKIKYMRVIEIKMG